MSEDIEQTVITRVKYYKGQPLTAQDFLDEQKYHNEKLKLLLSRFPIGIISGMEVSPNGDEGIIVKTGIAVNADGDFLSISDNQTVYVNDIAHSVSDNELKISKSEWANFIPNSKAYVNVSLKMIETIKNNSHFESQIKNNRIVETVNITFDISPDGPIAAIQNEKINKLKKAVVTIAVLEISPTSATPPKEFIIKENSPVVVNARIIEENQVQFSGVDGHDHSGSVNGKQIEFEKILHVLINSDEIIKAPPDGTPVDANTDGGTGIRTGHIRNGAVTSVKIHDAELTGNGEVNPDYGISTSHIQKGAVTSVKIHDAELTGNGEVNLDYGISTSHIQKGAVTSVKIHDAALKENGDVDPAYGISTSHIQKGAVTSVKIHDAALKGNGDVDPDYGISTSHIQKGAVTSVKIHDAALKENGEVDPDYGISTSHIQKGAVTSVKIHDAELKENGEVNSDYGISTSHIQNSAVTDEKLSIIEQEDNSFTIPGTKTYEYEVTVGKNCMIQVLPQISNGAISWNIKSITKNENIQDLGELTYKIDVKNLGGSVVSVQFRLIKFGICPDTPISVLMKNPIVSDGSDPSRI